MNHFNPIWLIVLLPLLGIFFKKIWVRRQTDQQAASWHFDKICCVISLFSWSLFILMVITFSNAHENSPFKISLAIVAIVLTLIFHWVKKRNFIASQKAEGKK